MTHDKEIDKCKKMYAQDKWKDNYHNCLVNKNNEKKDMEKWDSNLHYLGIMKSFHNKVLPINMNP